MNVLQFSFVKTNLNTVGNHEVLNCRNLRSAIVAANIGFVRTFKNPLKIIIRRRTGKRRRKRRLNNNNNNNNNNNDNNYNFI